MIGFEQQFAVAGLLRERYQFVGAVARQCRLASQIGAEQETPFSLEGRRAVPELLAYMPGVPSRQCEPAGLALGVVERRTPRNDLEDAIARNNSHVAELSR